MGFRCLMTSWLTNNGAVVGLFRLSSGQEAVKAGEASCGRKQSRQMVSCGLNCDG